MDLQTYLDEYMDGEVEAKEEYVVDSWEEAPVGNVEFEGCEYCGLRGRGKFTLHPDSLFLYFKDGRLKAIADIDHVYDKCREGLKENIRFLYRMLGDFKSRGFDAVVVGKAFDDDLYAWVKNGESSKKVEYEGFSILLSFVATLDGFEKMNWYMEMVDDDIVLEAINIFSESSMGSSSIEDGGDEAIIKCSHYLTHC